MRHIFIDIIGSKKKSFLIIYLCILVIDKLNYMIFSSFAITISYFVLSVIFNILLVYFYLSRDDHLPLDDLKKAATESFFVALKIATINILILFIICTPLIGFFSQGNLITYSKGLSFILIILLILGGIFMVSTTSFSIIHSIVEHTGVRLSFKNGIDTTKNSFRLILKIVISFILLAIPASTEPFIMGFLSLILQLSFISIAINSIKKRNAH